MPYFNDRKTEICEAWVRIDASELFSAQKGAIFAVLAHFYSSDEPAIVSMPTGSGKTELMIGLSYLLDARRVLVVEPGQVLREQAAKRFQELRVFREKELIPVDFPAPAVRIQRTKCGSDQAWRELQDFDVVVATPKVISPGERLVVPPPDPELFDLVFFDEAHHTPSPTWRALMRSFGASKVVLLTATPFRRDRRRLPGRLAFHYPIGRALDDGIYRHVQFNPVDYHADEGETERRLATEAARLFRLEQAQGNSPSVLVRTDRIEKANRLVGIYEATGLRVAAIHSKRSRRKNEDILEKLRTGELDTVVSVGMLGEGLDVPNLKIAVLHSPPKSLPFTIQLLGRVSRNLGVNEGPAHLLAVPDTVGGEARALYREDQDWSRMIPELMEIAIQEEYRVGGRGRIAGSLAVQGEAVKPFFSARFLSRKEDEWTGFDLEYNVSDPYEYSGLPNTLVAIHEVPTSVENAVVIITETEKGPAWGGLSGLTDVRHDLHVFYAPGHSNLLSVATTRDEICFPLLERIAPGTEGVDPANLPGALRNANEYVTVGLANASGLTGAHPSYRMHIGNGAGTSIRRSDGRVFGAGHAVARIDGRRIRGIAVRSRKTWEMKRDYLEPFLEWCNYILEAIEEPGGTLPFLEFLASPGLVRVLEEEPLAVLLPDILTWQPTAIRVIVGEETIEGDAWPFIEPLILSKDNLGFDANLHWREHTDPVRLTFRLGRQPLWSTEGTSVKVLLERGDDLQYELPLSRYFSLHPPTLVMPTGGIVRGDIQWRAEHEVDFLSDEILMERNWDDCDITKEASEARDGLLNVQESTLGKIIEEGPENLIVIDDDASYEVADLIVISPTEKVIRFVHCKYSSDVNPGCRLLDMKELLNQACRSHVWVRNQGLFEKLNRQVTERDSAKVVHGDVGTLVGLQDTYRRNEWSFEVIAVQPGLRIKDVIRGRGLRMRLSISSTHEWLLSADAKLVVWGS